jgi:glycosyltransferase involved in cell wall biosynthesis
MSSLEAALSRCAIVANDIPSYREIWGDAALYFRANDAGSLANVIRELSQQRDLCRAFGSRAYRRARERFTASRMIDEYLQVYRELLATRTAVA